MEPPRLPTPPRMLQISEKDHAEQIGISRRGGLLHYKNHDFPDATHLIRCHCYHCKEAYWLFASPHDDGSDSAALQVSYGTALHVPGCVGAAKTIQVPVRLRLIADPPLRFAKVGSPYMLKDKKSGVERWLVPTEYEVLDGGADSGDSDVDSAD